MDHKTSREQVEDLKRQWVNDPCWDIEDTEGFEDHRDELLEFSNSQKAAWAADRSNRARTFADKNGISDMNAAAYIMKLESMVSSMEARIRVLEGREQ